MVYEFLANGFEETEALVPVDMLRRCGITVKTVGIGNNVITGSHGIPVITDITDSEVVMSDDVEMIILPGGMPGTLNLEHSVTVKNAINYCSDNNIYIAAICAAPSILGHMGLLKGKKAVCFEGYESQLEGAEVLYDSVCVDGKIITARGAGVSLDFALKLIETLISPARSETLAASLMCK